MPHSSVLNESLETMTGFIYIYIYIYIQVEAIQINKDILKLLTIYMFEIMSSLQKKYLKSKIN